MIRACIVTCCLALAACADRPAGPPEPAAWALDLSRPESRPQGLPAGAAWVDEGERGGPCFRITLPPERADAKHAVSIPIDLRPWRGWRVALTARVRCEGVTTGAINWHGVKCQLHWTSASGGKRWYDEAKIWGSSPWRDLSAIAPVDADAENGMVILGMEKVSGTAWIEDVRVTPLAPRVELPAPRADAGPAFRGHDLPRLRGVMRPSRLEVQDFDDLKAWNVNFIRWRFARSWGVANTDMDLAEYDTWIDGQLDELERALKLAQERGIKLMPVLFNPPGGRLADNSFRMFFEARYQEHFIRTWERIARRFAGHPALSAWDLINEPVQNRPSPPGLGDWQAVQVRAAQAVRAIDATTPISVEVDIWDGPEAFPWLRPLDVPGVIYQVHMYWPHGYTHQQVHNDWGVASAGGQLVYPGMIQGTMADQAAMRRWLKPVRDFQLAYNVHVVVGEFSAVRWAPGADRWLADSIGLFEEYGWDWAYHAFREWPGWSVEHADAPVDRKNHPKATTPTAREKVLRGWFDQNRRFPVP